MSKKNGEKIGNKAFAGIWGGLLAALPDQARFDRFLEERTSRS